MLTNEEKAKIRLEEEYRMEVRDSLKTAGKNPNSTIAFFNSQLGLFILSTILVGGVSFTYKYFQEQEEAGKAAAAAEKERTYKYHKLNDEIRHRFTVLLKANDTLYEYQSKDINLVLSGNSIAGELNAQYYNFRSLYEEYGSWSIYRLLREFKRVEVDEGNQQRLDQILMLLAKNKETLNHLSENYFFVSIQGRILPSDQSVPFRPGEKVEKLFKLEEDPNILALIKEVEAFLT